MKKALIVLILALIATPVLARDRGVLPNTFASWYTVTTTSQTITFPYDSRDIAIHNGGSSAICVDIKGETVPHQCASAGEANTPSIFQLTSGTALNLTDYITGSISMMTLSGSASPVSVVVTY